MNRYIVAFSDDENSPWLYEFVSNDLEGVQDKVIDYIIDLYEFNEKVPLDYREFVKFCKKQEIYIGQIKQLNYE